MELDLNLIWFILVGVLLTGYAVLDGFDLGVGALHLFSKGDNERRIMLNSIGPVWDGNEVWLVTGGGAMFAAFPMVYATVFSGFYIAFMLLLFALIFRAIAIEFRSKRESAVWRRSWDVSFSVASLLAALLVGVALGNIARGIPLSKDFEFAGTFFSLLKPYPLLIGVTTVALFMLHGAIYLVLKTEGELQEKARCWVRNTLFVFIASYLLSTILTLLFLPHMTAALFNYPLLSAVPLLNLLAIVSIVRETKRKREGRAFISSSVVILCLMALFGLGIFPHIVLSNPNPEYSLTIYNAASSAKTLTYMLRIALIGMPFVLAYTAVIYWIFRGKVKLDAGSY